MTTPPTNIPPKKAPTKTIVIGAIVTLTILGFLAWGLFNTRETDLAIGEPAPDFQVQFFDGYKWQGAKSASLADWQGKVVVINFWASWCAPCRDEAPSLESLWQEYESEDVIIVGIAYLDTEPKSLAFLEEFDISYPNAPDLRSAISDEYVLGKVPETYILDKNGQLRQKINGMVNRAMLIPILEQLLAE